MAHVDTCVKSSIAFYHLYNQLLAKGHKFFEETIRVTLADDFGKSQRVLRTKVAVMLPETRDSRTLLDIGFIQNALMILNSPQFTWGFIEFPDKYELYDKEFATFWVPAGTSVNNIAALPEENAKTVLPNPPPTTSTYKLIPLALTPLRKPIFDGYSPHFADFMMRRRCAKRL